MAGNQSEAAQSVDTTVPVVSQSRLRPGQLSRAPSSGDQQQQQEIFMLPRQKSRSRERRESRMFLVDGQLCWPDDFGAPSSQSPGGAGYAMGKRSSSIGLMFGSSMDLSGLVAAGGQSIDSSGGGGSGSEEAISYRIKWCRENIMQLKRQCWPMEKKLQVLKASKMFIKQHQGELNQSKQAKDVLASTSAIFERYWRHFKREFANFLVIITPWEMRIKKIESHFGSVVASYFTFLRWIFWLNLANSLVMCSFVMVPELIENVPDLTGMRKGELGMQRSLIINKEEAEKRPDFNPTLGEMWEFEGFLKFSPIFYGYYSNVEISRSGFWRNPLAFLLSAMITYLFCFFCISRKLSQNTKLSRIGSKDDEYTFCWTVFVGWDFMIGNSETAYNKTSSLVMNLKEGILEEKEQTKDRNWRLILRRVFANALTIMLIIASAYVVTLAVQRSENLPDDASLLQKNELQLVMSGIQFMFPPLFDVIGIIEKYHPRKALSWQLGRILFLDFLNFYTLMFSLFGTVDQMSQQLNEVSGNITLLRRNTTYYNNLFTTTSTTTTTTQAPLVTMSTSEMTTVMNSSQEFSTASPLAAANETTATLGVQSADSSTNGSGTGQSYTTMSITNLPSTSSATTAPTGATTSETPVPPELGATARAPATPDGAGTSASIGGDRAAATRTEAAQTSTGTSGTSRGSPEELPAPTTTSSDEDYPDVQEALRQANEGRRRRRRKRQIESEEVEAAPLDDAERLAQKQQVQANRRQQLEEETHQRLAVGLPPIKDPYGKIGARSRAPSERLAGASWPPTSRALSQVYPGPATGSPSDDDEEPIEGRLEPGPATSPAPLATASSRRPRIGVARPIGGKGSPSGRVVAARPNVALSTASGLGDLNADSDEDAPPDQMDTSAEPGEPLTRAPGVLEAPAQPLERRPLGSESHNLSTGAEYSSTATSGAAPTAPTNLKLHGTTLGRATLAVARSGAAEEMTLGSLPSSAAAAEAATAATSTTAACPLASGSGATSATATETTGGGGSSNHSLGQLTLHPPAANVNGSPSEDSQCSAGAPDFKPQEILALNETLKEKLKTLCWETMFGQEMVKIVVMDLVMTVVSAVSFEFMRACFVRYCNRFFFWDLERGFPGYQDFKIAENVLHLVNNQSTVWMGMFFAPGLPAINTVKLAVLMYVRSWAVLTCNIPHETVFKVSKSNNFYYWILLINLLICILPVAYAVTWIRPSWHCGPFGGECRMYLVVTKLLKQLLPPEANAVFRYITSPGAVIPLLIALILIIYYLASTVSSSKEANKELKAQLKKDKEQESAVPEITSTAVAEPAAAGPEAPTAATATAQASASGAAGLPAAALSSSATLATPAGLPTSASSEMTRPKSLLAPPPI